MVLADNYVGNIYLEDKTIKGRVIKGVAGKFTVLVDDVEYKAFARGKLKNDGEIRVGDMVEIESNRSYVIEKVYPRQNSLIRPYVANIDMAIITIAESPKPDFVLVDKILINCKQSNIKPILCVNKMDILSKELKQSIETDYKGIVDIYYVSAHTKQGILELEKLIENKVVCFCGQSAVGKSSIINCLLEDRTLEVGGLSKKTERGKHTTRVTEIIKVAGGYVVDTCGFSMLENIDINEKDLALYYPEFYEPSYYCKYRGCNHIHEPECEVKKLVEDGTISRSRYDRYIQIYEQIKETRRK